MQFDLYIQIDDRQSVIGVDDLSLASLPPFTQGDSLDLRIFCLTRISGGAAYVPVTGRTLQVVLGPKPATGTYYTQQFTWTPSTDLGQPYFAATLPMDTAAITSLLDGGASAKAYFGIALVESGVPRTILSRRVTVEAAVIAPGVAVVPANQTALSVEVANATYLSRNISGIYYLINASDPTKKVAIFVGDDGAFHAEPVT